MLTNPETPLVAKFRAEVIDKFHPGIKMYWKDESLAMKILYYVFFIFLWNPTFLTRYTTVGFGRIWFARESWSQKTEEERLRTMIHEGAHLYDTKQNFFRPVLTIFPQLPIAILSVALAFVSPWFLFGLILAVLPLPAPWRYWGEIRAYRLDCLFVHHVWGWPKGEGLHKEYQKRAVEQMTGSFYYFAWPFPGLVKKDLEKDDSKDPYVIMVFEWLKKEGLLKTPYLK